MEMIDGKPVNVDVAKRDFKYYIFDWDDNILHMPTRIYLEKLSCDGVWRPVSVSTSTFALVRTDTAHYRMPRTGGREAAFRDFQDTPDARTGDLAFIRDTKSALARIAAGEPMTCAHRAPFTPFGHAIEFRINAEDPDNGFIPCPGTITRFEAPAGPGVRVESYVSSGSRISPYYDSLVAKLIVYGQSREEALARGRRALDEFVIEGIKTTLPFHRRVLDNEVFCAGEATTDFIETQMGDLL